MQTALRLVLLSLVAGLLATSCATRPSGASASSGSGGVPASVNVAQTLGSGDVIKITFAGAPNLDTTQQIRRDGKINLTLIGEVQASEKTPLELEAELLRLFGAHLVSKEIKVTVMSSSFSIFVTGAVQKPGKISPDRGLTALEAIMEAGGFDNARANAKSVRVIRHEGGKVSNFTLDLKAALDGQPTEPFYLRSNDIIYVPEKFAWF